MNKPTNKIDGNTQIKYALSKPPRDRVYFGQKRLDVMIRNIFSLFGILAFAAGVASGSPVVVDHQNYNAIDTMPTPRLQALANLKVFFAHASVGGNIVAGMKVLNSQNPVQYPDRKSTRLNSSH